MKKPNRDNQILRLLRIVNKEYFEAEKEKNLIKVKPGRKFSKEERYSYWEGKEFAYRTVASELNRILCNPGPIRWIS